jgi:isocitrate dehydrogenase kinase/phosphatase
MHDLPRRLAATIADAFAAYHAEFKAITQRAKRRFEAQDWPGTQRDAIERLEIYGVHIARTVATLQVLVREGHGDQEDWVETKGAFTALAAARNDYNLAETFYNSVVRRFFAADDVDQQIVYIANEVPPPALDPARPVYRSYRREAGTAALIAAILRDNPFAVPYRSLEQDAELAGEAIDAELQARYGTSAFDLVDMAQPVFYRNKGAYLIGRIRIGDKLAPLALSLLNEGQGIVLDAALCGENETSIVFSFTRSYFQVDAARPHELAAFLLSIMPHKRLSELYTSIGYNKHGKTELYRRLMWLFAHTDEQFEAARGEPGLVMTVFTMPSLAVVFKIIKDSFGFPKTASRAHVIDRYNLVFRHDRAGRLADAQEFEYLRIHRERFRPELLDHLLKVAKRTVALEGDTVVIRHCYTERKMTPLNLYVKEARPAQVEAAVIDFGQAIKDLAATNIFPGDVLLKNFGVTRHGRVVFYDYDELCLLTDLNFRAMPEARSYDDELAAEPWFSVAENDIFPEEFRRFLGLAPALREIFSAHHDDLFAPEFWRAMQARHQRGEVVDIYPYPEHRRLRG